MEITEPKMLNFRGKEYPCCARLTMGLLLENGKQLLFFI